MPRLGQDTTEMTQSQIGGSTFQFSAAKIDNLGATEYTLADLIFDCSGSTDPYRAGMTRALKEIIKSLRKAPRADNLLVRVSVFDTHAKEFHGYKPLMDCNEADYDAALYDGGSTALFDAGYTAIKAQTQYAKDLATKDYQVNGIVMIATDGEDNASRVTAKMMGDALQEAKKTEALESIMTILVGVNVGSGGSLTSYLDNLKVQAGLQQFVPLPDADEKTLSRLAQFVSKSVSSQSQALGTGGPSASITI